MALSATRLALATLLLGSSAAHAGWFDLGSSKKAVTKDDKAVAAQPSSGGTSLEDSIRQAHMLRLAGNYPEAIKHLSQVMMVASDDPRVVSEYGKTLAAMGRAQDAVSFLTRAAQLQPGDWSTFSALGVAYDQVGNQKEAQGAYENALVLKPGEPSVLSNYALSRMLANDPAMAKRLAGRAEIANAPAQDPKITANIALIRSMAPEAADASYAVNTPAPKPMPSMALPRSAPRVPVAANPMPTPFVPQAGNAPRMLAAPADAGIIDAPPQMAQGPAVVMQRVPMDPFAGPVSGRPVAAKAPRSTAPRKSVAKAQVKKGEALDMSTARSESPKPAAIPANATAPGVKSAASQAEDLQARAEAMAKQLTNKPAAIAAAKAEASKPTAPHVVAQKATPAPVKAAEAKPAPAPHVLPEKPAAKTAAAPKAVPASGKAKDTIPGLRLSANAY